MRRAAAPPTVLLVEDEVLISHLVAEPLSERGFSVHEVTTADAALRYIGSGANLDVLFTDINLSGRINRAELAERARVAAARSANRLCLRAIQRRGHRCAGAALDLRGEAL